MVQLVKCLPLKLTLDDLNLIARSRMLEEGNQLPQVVL